MTGLVLLWCLAQAPSSQPAVPIAVVVSSKRPGADTFSGNAAARVHAALLREGIPAADALDDVATGKKVKAAGFSDARNCQGGAKCLAKLALLLGPNAVVVGVDVGKIGGQLAIRLEAVSAKTGTSLFVTDVSSPVEGWGDKVAVPIALFARQLVEKVAVAAPVAIVAPPVRAPDPVVTPKDAPLAAELTPPPQPPAETRRSTPAAIKWTLGIGGVAAAGVSVGFLVVGLGTQSAFNGKPRTYPTNPATFHTYDEAQQLAAQSNSQLTISLISGVVGAVLLATAAFFFLSE